MDPIEDSRFPIFSLQTLAGRYFIKEKKSQDFAPVLVMYL